MRDCLPPTCGLFDHLNDQELSCRGVWPSLVEEAGTVPLRQSEVLSALSLSLDLTEGQPYGHASYSCLIAMRLADQMRLDGPKRQALYYATLLKDLGCSSNAAKMAYLFGTDERRVKHRIKQIDWPRIGESFRLVASHVAPGERTLTRVMKVAAMLLQGPKGAAQLVQVRCERGASIARQLGLSPETAQAILHLDEHWNGKGHPHGIQGEEISLLGRIASLAQTVAVFHGLGGRAAARQVAAARRGRWFDPALVDAFLSLPDSDHLWAWLDHSRPDELVVSHDPMGQPQPLDENGMDRICEAFASVVDAKSPWTFRHSEGVAQIATGMATVMGFDEQSIRWIRRMGLLHDIGKLGISNAILDKPAKPTETEFAEIKRHTVYTREILGRIRSLQPFATLAAAHHERLDGRGYHLQISSRNLPVVARMLTVADIYEALTAARPYRDGLPKEKALSLLRNDAGKGVCLDCFTALENWLENQQPQERVQLQMDACEVLLQEL